MTIDPRERELLAQLLGVTVVRLDIDRALEEERLVETVELFLDGLRGALRSVDLRRERLAASIREAPRPDPFQQLFFRVLACRVVFERPPNERSALRVVHQALAIDRGAFR